MRNFISTSEHRYQNIPENLSSDRCQQKIDAILDDPNGYKVKDEYNHADVRTLLRNHFGVKCVYCEASPIATSTFRIDHYRPKKGIKDVDNHTGYYWLGYEWSNLMQACQFCNAEKSNYFPLKNNSVRVDEDTPNATNEAYRKPSIAPLNTEERLLLQPELDEVEDHFSFEADGCIDSDTEEGEASIIHYGLNRPDLISVRKQIRDDHLDEIKELLKEYEVRSTINAGQAKDILFSHFKSKFKRFLLFYKTQREFSLFHFYMFDRFDSFFVNHIQINEHQQLMREAYNLYKQRNL